MVITAVESNLAARLPPTIHEEGDTHETVMVETLELRASTLMMSLEGGTPVQPGSGRVVKIWSDSAWTCNDAVFRSATFVWQRTSWTDSYTEILLTCGWKIHVNNSCSCILSFFGEWLD